jgi:hypothetical protein
VGGDPVSIPICRDCGAALGQEAEKAIGSGEVQMVWASLTTGEWVCPKTGDEHVQTWRDETGHWKGTDKVEGHVVKEQWVAETAPGAFIVIEGNPIDGFVAHGIPAFTEHDAAVEWAAETCENEWWVMPLQDVE